MPEITDAELRKKHDPDRLYDECLQPERLIAWLVKSGIVTEYTDMADVDDVDRCCCGRIMGFTEPVIAGDILHERLGDEGAFCGPVYRHTIRDQEKEIGRLTVEVGRLRRIVEATTPCPECKTIHLVRKGGDET